MFYMAARGLVLFLLCVCMRACVCVWFEICQCFSIQLLSTHQVILCQCFIITAVDSVMVDSDEEDGVSFRMVLPSESHRKQSKGRLRSAGDSVSSLATSHGDLSGV